MGFIVLNVIIKLLIRMGKNFGIKWFFSLLDFQQQNWCLERKNLTNYEINSNNQH